MRLEVEIPSFLHCDASVDYGAGKGVVAMFCVRVLWTRRVETGVVALADDNNCKYLGLQLLKLK